MKRRGGDLHLGIGACAASLIFIFVLIPGWVSSPSNVRNIVLSPLFWPYTVAGLTGLVGLGLVWSSLRARGDAAARAPFDRAAWTRLLVAAAIMIAAFYALPRLGMVWTSMATFAATAFLIRTRHPVLAIVCAILAPLALYAFFAHVAGVAIPQGVFVRLP